MLLRTKLSSKFVLRPVAISDSKRMCGASYVYTNIHVDIYVSVHRDIIYENDQQDTTV